MYVDDFCDVCVYLCVCLCICLCMCLCSQALRSVSQAWANPSAVKHTPLEQQLYVSKALLLSVSLLSDSELQELRSGTKWRRLSPEVAQ